jgi:preprotein translocase subunit SecF
MIVVAVVAYIYGVTSIQSFALPMIAGLVSGTYSSVCIAGPLWVRWQERQAAKAAA